MRKRNKHFQSCFTLIMIIGYLGQIYGQTVLRPLNQGHLTNTPSDSRSVNFVDINNDGLEDLLITQGNSSGASDFLYINKGNFTFEHHPELTASISDPSVGATIVDMNNDGYPDIYVASWYNLKNVLYKTSNEKPIETIIMYENSYSESATWGDYNNDGYLDLYVCNAGNSAADNHNFLYKNDNGTLTIQSGHKLVKETNYSRSATWVDYDKDGDVDLFICNENNTRNDLFKNNGFGSFSKVSSAGALLQAAEGSMSASWGDVNNDGWMDVFICNSGFYVGQENRLYLNNGNGSFTRKNGVFEVEKSCSFSGSFTDYDNDGDLDLLVTNGFCIGDIYNVLYLNDGDGNFIKDTISIPDFKTSCSFGSAWGDLNNDGFQDLVIANCKNTAQSPMPNNSVWVNAGNQNHWLKIKLDGNISNRNGIGAKLYTFSKIYGKQIQQMREHTSVSGYCSQNSSTIHFGLADGNIVDSIKIEWPSGITQVLTNIATNQLIVIHESSINRVNEIAKISSFNISPNPATDKVQITIEFEGNIDTLFLELISPNGELLYKNTFFNIESHWKYTLDFDQIERPNGMYIVKIGTNNWKMHKKILLNF